VIDKSTTLTRRGEDGEWCLLRVSDHSGGRKNVVSTLVNNRCLPLPAYMYIRAR
jgi:hypothetical protein